MLHEQKYLKYKLVPKTKFSSNGKNSNRWFRYYNKLT